MNYRDQFVAVKKINVSQQRKRRLDTFLKDTYCLFVIDHPNVVKLLGVGSENNFVFVVMELSDGCSGW